MDPHLVLLLKPHVFLNKMVYSRSLFYFSLKACLHWSVLIGGHSSHQPLHCGHGLRASMLFISHLTLLATHTILLQKWNLFFSILPSLKSLFFNISMFNNSHSFRLASQVHQAFNFALRADSSPTSPYSLPPWRSSLYSSLISNLSSFFL